MKVAFVLIIVIYIIIIYLVMAKHVNRVVTKIKYSLFKMIMNRNAVMMNNVNLIINLYNF